MMKHGWVCLKIVYPYTQWLMIIIPTKWLYSGVYPIFRHTQMFNQQRLGEVVNILRSKKNPWQPHGRHLGTEDSILEEIDSRRERDGHSDRQIDDNLMAV